MPQPRLSPLLVVLVLSAGACQKRPAAPPPAPPPPPATASAKPPPPPVCKSIDAKCSAKADTKLEIGDGAATFHPPPGWLYAHQAGASIAIAGGTVAAMAFGVAKSPHARDTMKVIDKLLDGLEITNLARKPFETRLAHAQTKVDTNGGLDIELWEVNKRRQFGSPPHMSGKPASVLVVVAKLPDQRAVVGVASVLKPGGDDKVPAIMTAVKSLRSGK